MRGREEPSTEREIEDKQRQESGEQESERKREIPVSCLLPANEPS